MNKEIKKRNILPYGPDLIAPETPQLLSPVCIQMVDDLEFLNWGVRG